MIKNKNVIGKSINTQNTWTNGESILWHECPSCMNLLKNILIINNEFVRKINKLKKIQAYL